MVTWSAPNVSTELRKRKNLEKIVNFRYGMKLNAMDVRLCLFLLSTAHFCISVGETSKKDNWRERKEWGEFQIHAATNMIQIWPKS